MLSSVDMELGSVLDESSKDDLGFEASDFGRENIG